MAYTMSASLPVCHCLCASGFAGPRVRAWRTPGAWVACMCAHPTCSPVERHTFPRKPMGLVAGICGAIPAGLSVDGIAAGSTLLRPFKSKHSRILPADMQLYLRALSTPCAGSAQLLFPAPSLLTSSCMSFALPPHVGVSSACDPSAQGLLSTVLHQTKRRLLPLPALVLALGRRLPSYVFPYNQQPCRSSMLHLQMT